MTRRTFLFAAAATSAMTLVFRRRTSADTEHAMIYRTLGRTGERVSAIGLGGFHIGQQKDEQESIRLIRSAIDRGITFLDNSWDYNGGASEMRWVPRSATATGRRSS